MQKRESSRLYGLLLPAVTPCETLTRQNDPKLTLRLIWRIHLSMASMNSVSRAVIVMSVFTEPHYFALSRCPVCIRPFFLCSAFSSSTRCNKPAVVTRPVAAGAVAHPRHLEATQRGAASKARPTWTDIFTDPRT